MKISTLPIEEIKPYEKNPRRNDQAVDKVANSIREFGFRQPIVVDETNTIIIGHTRTFYGSTWTMNRANVLQLLQLFDTGRFDQIAILTGTYFKRGKAPSPIPSSKASPAAANDSWHSRTTPRSCS